MSLADRDYMKKNYRHKTKNSSRFKGWNPHSSAYKGRKGNYINKSKNWFFDKKHPHSNLRLGDFLTNIGIITALCIILSIIYSCSDIFTVISVWLLGLIVIVGLSLMYFILKYSYKALINIRYGIRGLTNGAKLILVILLIVFSFQVYQVRDDVISPNLLLVDKYIDNSSIKEDVSSIIETWEESVVNITEEVYKESTPTYEELKECEKYIFDKTNERRRGNNLPNLVWDSNLANIARDHSLDMAQNNFFDHTNLRDEDPTARAIRQGYSVYKELGGGWYSEGIGENIGKMSTGNVRFSDDFSNPTYVSNDPESIATALMRSWMFSPGHRGNILDSGYDKIGIGVAYDGEDYISTQNFW